jgi:hypothetical protein
VLVQEGLVLGVPVLGVPVPGVPVPVQLVQVG